MHRSAVLLACAVGTVVMVSGPQAQSPQPPQQPPIFRGGVEVIRLDVSVLDKDRRPVRGLTADDFTVREDGKVQTIVSVAEIDTDERDPAPSAWMRHVPRDVTANDLSDQTGDGRLFGIVMDDVNVPWDDVDITMAARAVGRYVVNGLGPSDVAALMMPRDSGRTQDFTDDHSKLLEAIDRFDPRQPDYVPYGNTDLRPGPGGGDMPQRFSPVLGRTNCQRRQLMVPALDTLVSRLAAVPNRRKTVIVVSTGVPLDFSATQGCPKVLADEMKDVFRRAQRGNINIYSIDPAGYRGYENYLLDPIRRGGRPAAGVPSQRGAELAARFRHDFMEIMADNTGARAIVNTDEIESGIKRIFQEDGSYYLVGYQASNTRLDGKFRHIEVKVNRPGVTVRTRSGYWAPVEGSLLTREARDAPTTNDLGMTGMMNGPGLPLRVAIVPIGVSHTNVGKDSERAQASEPRERSGESGVPVSERVAGSAGAKPPGPMIDIAAVLTVRLPAPRGPLSETLTIVRNLYDATGKPGPPKLEKVPLALQPTSGDDLLYDVFWSLTLPPGRHELRVNATSAALDRSGSVYADIDVPDFTRSAVSVSGIVLGTPPAESASRTDPLASLVPIIPTSARDFAPGAPVSAFVKIFQGGSSQTGPVNVSARLVDVLDKVVFEKTDVLPVEAFGDGRSADYQLDLPRGGLPHGPYVLSFTAKLADGRSTRRDLVIRMR